VKAPQRKVTQLVVCILLAACVLSTAACVVLSQHAPLNAIEAACVGSWTYMRQLELKMEPL
jgi:hypothetical protein